MEKDKRKPLFMYLHLLYPHVPYNPPPPFDSMFGEGFEMGTVDSDTRVRKVYEVAEHKKDQVINMYDGEIRFTDMLIGELFGGLNKRNLLEIFEYL